MSDFAETKETQAVQKAAPQTSAVKSFFSGGFGGIAAVLVGHPFDLAKVTIPTIKQQQKVHGNGIPPIWINTRSIRPWRVESRRNDMMELLDVYFSAYPTCDGRSVLLASGAPLTGRGHPHNHDPKDRHHVATWRSFLCATTLNQKRLTFLLLCSPLTGSYSNQPRWHLQGYSGCLQEDFQGRWIPRTLPRHGNPLGRCHSHLCRLVLGL